MKKISTSRFEIRYFANGRENSIVFESDAFAAESSARSISKSARTNVELIHRPDYSSPVKLCTVLCQKHK